MKSSSGAYFIALDHIRALAAFMVVVWHFCHSKEGYPVALNFTPSLFPFAILDEGHTGIALFITLSGYLFAKLLDNKSIDFPAFIWNRILRLFPLLAVVILIIGLRTYLTGENLSAYIWDVASGPILPSLPHGAWSVTAEFHCYVVLPFLLLMFRKSKFLPFTVILAAIVLRYLIYEINGSVHILAYSTVLGRIDQFTLGLLAYQFRNIFTGRHFFVFAVFNGFALVYWYFDSLGGFYQNQGYPSLSRWWIFLPTVEGIAYAIGIAWYDNSFSLQNRGVSAWIAKIGGYSYSIYLLHFFFVFRAAQLVNERIMSLSHFYIACLWSFLFFLLMVPIGYLSFRFVEAPFLRLRKPYLHPFGGNHGIFWQRPKELPRAGR